MRFIPGKSLETCEQFQVLAHGERLEDPGLLRRDSHLALHLLGPRNRIHAEDFYTTCGGPQLTGYLA